MKGAARQKKSRPLVVAHRGSSGSAPENTLAAFRLAVEEGADMIELDVRMSRDFHLVVHHDRNVRRTTNGEGFIWDKTLNELRMLDAGSWYDQRFKGEQIPTLRQVMEMLPDHVTLNIEAKTDGDPRKRNHFEECCILIIMEKKFEERAIVSSFDHKFLKRMHDLFPSIKTGALYVPVRDMAKKPSTIARKTGASAFNCSVTQLRRRFVDDAHAHKLIVGCYTINNEKQLAKMLHYGVDAVITNFPGEISRILSH
jgi:glycerophosphoryl diester phosphodiesterase